VIQKLIKKIERKDAKVGVVGLGYVGLPYALEFAKRGFSVLGIDLNSQRVEAVRAGRSYILDIPSEELASLVKKGKLTATTDFARAGQCDVLNVCVPTPLNKTRDPDMSSIVSAFLELRKRIRKDQLFILSSTTYPGTTSELVLPMLNEVAVKKGLRVGRDFFLAFSPERIDPGNKKYNINDIPKVVGGITQQCVRASKAFYSQIVDHVIPVSSTSCAETVKLLENTFRSINIGLVNEVAIMCDKLGINVWEVIDAASSKPYGFMPFYPGPGLGGHCIPVDPNYLSWKLRALDYRAKFIELAEEVNKGMPFFVVEKLEKTMRERIRKSLLDSRVLILGVAYKKDVNDSRESPAFEVVDLLIKRGAIVTYHDPFIPNMKTDNFSLASARLTPYLIKAQDAVLVLTDHSTFEWEKIIPYCRLLFDTRNATKNVEKGSDKIARL